MLALTFIHKCIPEWILFHFHGRNYLFPFFMMKRKIFSNLTLTLNISLSLNFTFNDFICLHLNFDQLIILMRIVLHFVLNCFGTWLICSIRKRITVLTFCKCDFQTSWFLYTYKRLFIYVDDRYLILTTKGFNPLVDFYD